MGFLSYDKTTGLVVKSKANILEDLKQICKNAYGSNFVVTEGTEMYSLLDILSTALAENGTAAKKVYDSFGFIGATGTPLDVLCSLAGISRKEGESDNGLRARYFKFLYSQSVGTEQGLEAKLLSETTTDTPGDTTTIKSLVDEVKMYNNTDGSPKDFISTKDLLAHSIAVVCRNSDAFFVITTDKTAVAGKVYYIKFNNLIYVPVEKATDDSLEDTTYYTEIDTSSDLYSELRKQLSDVVADYKSLGCGVLQDGDDYNYWVAQYSKLYVSFNLNILSTYISGTSIKGAIENQIQTNVTEYMNNLKIGEDVMYSGLMSCVYTAYAQLGYSGYMFDCSNICQSVITDTSNLVVKFDNAAFINNADVAATPATYTFTYNGSKWRLSNNDVELTDYGITTTGNEVNNDSITITLSTISVGSKIDIANNKYSVLGSVGVYFSGV